MENFNLSTLFERRELIVGLLGLYLIYSAVFNRSSLFGGSVQHSITSSNRFVRAVFRTFGPKGFRVLVGLAGLAMLGYGLLSLFSQS